MLILFTSTLLFSLILLLAQQFVVGEGKSATMFIIQAPIRAIEMKESGRRRERLSGKDDESEKILEFLRQNIVLSEEVPLSETKGESEPDTSIPFDQRNHSVHPLFLLTASSDENGGNNDNTSSSSKSSKSEEEVSQHNENVRHHPKHTRRHSSNHQENKNRHSVIMVRDNGHGGGTLMDDDIVTWPSFENGRPEDNTEGTHSNPVQPSNSFPLIEAPLAMSNPFYRILRRAYRMLRRQSSNSAGRP